VVFREQVHQPLDQPLSLPPWVLRVLPERVLPERVLPERVLPERVMARVDQRLAEQLPRVAQQQQRFPPPWVLRERER
jgi:hypothetical protein